MNGMKRHMLLLLVALMLGACAHVDGVIRIGSDPPEPHDPPFAHEQRPDG
jgi:hypothetical protein